MIRQKINKTIRYAGAIAALCLFTGQDALANPMYFYPAETWQITHTNLTCRIKNQFNNGFIITIEDKKSGTQNFLSNLTLNFRQPVFTSGKIYNASVAFGEDAPQLLQVHAIDQETLSIPLGNYTDMMDKALKSPTLKFAIEGNDFNFSMVGLQQSVKNFAACTGESAPQPAAAKPSQTPFNPHADLYSQIQAQTGTPLPTAARPTTVVPTHPAPAPAKAKPAPVKATTANAQPQKLPDHLYAQIKAQTAPEGTDAQNQPKNLITPPSQKPSTAAQEAANLEPIYGDETDTIKTMPILNTSDWNLEKATMRFQEAERQLTALGQKLQKERAQCKIEKKELEALLFDPQLTSEQQLAKLSSLEEELQRTKIEMQNQKVRYEERIKILENQLNSF